MGRCCQETFSRSKSDIPRIKIIGQATILFGPRTKQPPSKKLSSHFTSTFLSFEQRTIHSRSKSKLRDADRGSGIFTLGTEGNANDFQKRGSDAASTAIYVSLRGADEEGGIGG